MSRAARVEFGEHWGARYLRQPVLDWLDRNAVVLVPPGQVAPIHIDVGSKASLASRSTSLGGSTVFFQVYLHQADRVTIRPSGRRSDGLPAVEPAQFDPSQLDPLAAMVQEELRSFVAEHLPPAPDHPDAPIRLNASIERLLGQLDQLLAEMRIERLEEALRLSEGERQRLHDDIARLEAQVESLHDALRRKPGLIKRALAHSGGMVVGAILTGWLGLVPSTHATIENRTEVTIETVIGSAYELRLLCEATQVGES